MFQLYYGIYQEVTNVLNKVRNGVLEFFPFASLEDVCRIGYAT